MKIECPICLDNNAECWWTSDSDGAVYTWITWHHECPHCGYTVKKIEQWMLNYENIETCTIPGHKEAPIDNSRTMTINHAINTNVNFGGEEYQTEKLKNEIAKLHNRLSELEIFEKRSLEQGGIFISHSHADKDIVSQIVKRFESDNINYWLDDKDLLIGQVIDKAISEGIQRNWLFLIILTPTSVSSKWVERELDEASHEEVEGNKIILPVVAKGLEADKIPARLKRKLYADVSFDFESGYGKLKKAIVAYLEKRARQ